MNKKITLIISAMLSCSTFTQCGRYATDAADTIFGEYKLSELNRKYEWFKDAHAKLASLQQQVQSKKGQIDSLKETYKDVPRNQWLREDIQNLAIAEQEYQGIKATFNNLAAEYNSEMSKFHTYFTNTGPVPQGSNLPQQFIPYN